MSSSFFINPRSNPELRSLYQILLLPVAETPLQDYFCNVMTVLSESFPINYSALLLHEAQKDYLRVEGLYGIPKDAHPIGCSGRKGTMRKVLDTCQPMVLHDLCQEPLYESLTEETRLSEKIRPPLLCIPLIADGEPIGLMNINSLYGPRDFVNEGFQFLVVLSALLSPVIRHYQIEKSGLAAKGTKAEPKSTGLEDFLAQKLGEFVNRIDPYVESKTKMSLLDDIISVVEKILIKSALERVNHVQLAAAQLLGINRNTLRKKMKELKIKSR